MRFMECRCLRTAAAAGALVLSLLLSLGTARAQDKTYTMKITLATINDQIHAFAKNFAAALEKDSGGQIKPEIYPASQLGAIPRQTEGVQFGAIQCQLVPPEFLVGIDERFEVMAAPGLVTSMAQGQKLAADPAVLKLMLSLGADKGLHGVGLFMVNPSAIASRTPIRHLADFKGKKIRIFASPFQSTSFDRLGATPVAMTLGDVLPALQQGAIDGAVASTAVFTAFHYQDAAKYATETGQPAIFAIIEISRKWYDTLPPDLQQVIDQTAARE
jgi:TRAP-type transport system periplasmic protein